MNVHLIFQVVQLEADKHDLERQLREAKASAEGAERKVNEQRHVEEKKHMEEINFLKKTNQQLKVCCQYEHHFDFLLSESTRRIDRTEKINAHDPSILYGTFQNYFLLLLLQFFFEQSLQ